MEYNEWKEESKWEKNWWGNCANTLREELLQFSYAERMGLQGTYDGRTDFNIDLKGKSVLDIGGGPISLLLKCKNFSRAMVSDPCEFPKWVLDRYKSAGVEYMHTPGEALTSVQPFDEVWIYNVLQHTMDPELIVKNAMACGDIVRVFEYIDAGVSPGHPHDLTAARLNKWFGSRGIVEDINEIGDSNLNKHGAIGRCYYGAFTK